MRYFKGKQFKKDIILVAVGYYCRFSLSYRDVSEILKERGISVHPTTIMRWVHEYGNLIYQIWKKKNKSAHFAWHLDETYIKIKGEWCYLYRAMDSGGNTIDFYLSHKRDAMAAKRFLKKALASCHATKPRSITADGDKAYPVAIRELKKEKCIPHSTPLRVKKYLNNIIEQDHRFIKKRIRNMLGLKSLQTATKMIAGVEAMHMLKKGQTRQGEKSVQKQIYLINEMFGLTA
ncbi:IS6 family transposase [Bacillus wiedmannii]